MPAPQTFAVIGAGVAGLQAAAQLKAAGKDVTIFEKSGDVGGVWQQNYTGYRLQVQKWHYEIPGFKWEDGLSPSHPRYPTGAEVQAYLQKYAAHAGLLPLVRFRADVRGVSPADAADAASADAAAGAAEPGAAGWVVEWAGVDGAVRSEPYDFVVVATGLFNTPERPAWAEGLASAKPPPSGPWVVDARDFTDAEAARGKHVVVVGAGKTAHDVGVAVSGLAASTTLVARRGHWMAPQKVMGFLPFEFASYTRWSWALQPAWYAAGGAKKAAHTLAAPIKAAAWGLFGLLFPLQTGTPAALKPKHGLLEGVYDTVGMLDAGALRAAFRSGRLGARAGRVAALAPAGVQLEGGGQLPADVVVLATGYRPTAAALLPAQLRGAAGYKGNAQWLYRNVLPPGLDNLAFIGLNATFQHVLTTALQSRWLVDALSGAIPLPPPTERKADIAAQEAWLAKSARWRRSNHTWAQHGKYHDSLVREIRGGASPRAYPAYNPLAELFGYIKNSLYAPLFPHNAAAAGAAKAAAHKSAGASAGGKAAPALAAPGGEVAVSA